MPCRLDRFDSPIGDILLVCDDQDRLRALDFADCESRMRRLLRLHYGAAELASGSAPPSILRALRAYFAGDHGALASIPVATGGTPFQRSVWTALLAIPPGVTTTYGALATSLDRPAAVRAAGMANGANPIGIVVPCHRVVGADASLTGYGGGLERKRWLLRHEGAAFRDAQRSPELPFAGLGR